MTEHEVESSGIKEIGRIFHGIRKIIDEEMMNNTKANAMSGYTVVGRVSATSTTSSWSSRVDSTEHPEFTSLPSDNSEGTGPLRLTGP